MVVRPPGPARAVLCKEAAWVSSRQRLSECGPPTRSSPSETHTSQAPLNQPGKGFRTSDLTFLEVTVLVQEQVQDEELCLQGGERELGAA